MRNRPDWFAARPRRAPGAAAQPSRGHGPCPPRNSWTARRMMERSGERTAAPCGNGYGVQGGEGGAVSRVCSTKPAVIGGDRGDSRGGTL